MPLHTKTPRLFQQKSHLLKSRVSYSFGTLREGKPYHPLNCPLLVTRASVLETLFPELICSCRQLVWASDGFASIRHSTQMRGLCATPTLSIMNVNMATSQSEETKEEVFGAIGKSCANRRGRRAYGRINDVVEEGDWLISTCWKSEYVNTNTRR